MPNLQNGDTGKKLIEEVNSALDKRGNIVGYDENGEIITNNTPQKIKGSIEVEDAIIAERILKPDGEGYGSTKQYIITETTAPFYYGNEYANKTVIIVKRRQSGSIIHFGYLSNINSLKIGSGFPFDKGLIPCNLTILDTSGSYDHCFRCPLVYNSSLKEFYWDVNNRVPIEKNLSNHNATISKEEDGTQYAFSSGYAPVYDFNNKTLTFDTNQHPKYKSYFFHTDNIHGPYYSDSIMNFDDLYPRNYLIAEGYDLILTDKVESNAYNDNEELNIRSFCSVSSGLLSIDLSKVEEIITSRVIGYVYII